ncbi:MAG: KH domain-containing protein [Bacilli bacterium]|nr:KH domain-containing protein [Bacilli bacterium]
MELVKLTETIVKELVNDAESVSVKEFPSEDEDVVTIQVLVPEDQMGRVIGNQGKLAKSLRTIVQASAYINGNKRVNINIDSY